MSEFLDRDLRVNDTLERLTALLAEQRARIPGALVVPLYSTTPDGRVLDRIGKEVYTPKPLKGGA